MLSVRHCNNEWTEYYFAEFHIELGLGRQKRNETKYIELPNTIPNDTNDWQKYSKIDVNAKRGMKFQIALESHSLFGANHIHFTWIKFINFSVWELPI